MLCELHGGTRLFYFTADRLERLALLERVLGTFPVAYVESLADSSDFVFQEVGVHREARVAFFKQGLAPNREADVRQRVRKTVQAPPLMVRRRRCVCLLSVNLGLRLASTIRT